MHVERTFTVDQPIDQVFAYLSDFENTNEWDPGTVETRKVSGDGGVGTKYHNRSKFLGKETDLSYETKVHEAPTKFVMEGINKSATATDTLNFRDVGGKTEIHYRADFAFKGIAKFVAPIVARKPLEKLADETVDQIKKTLNRT
ncbi:MAG: polyketide cyclase [Nocardioidaceae bacterium]|nr:polyketide cyclase [Nocardioidaceae bacterium]